MTGRNMDPYMGGHSSVMGWRRCFLVLSVAARNHLRREYRCNGRDKSLLDVVFVAAAVIAMLLGFSPKFGR